MLKQSFLVGIFLISILTSCKNFESEDFVGDWLIEAEVEGYEDGELVYNKLSDDSELSLSLNGDGIFVDEGISVPLVWAYIPTREKIYLQIEPSDSTVGTIIYGVNRVSKNSQVWKNERLATGTKTRDYFYTWRLTRK